MGGVFLPFQTSALHTPAAFPHRQFITARTRRSQEDAAGTSAIQAVPESLTTAAFFIREATNIYKNANERALALTTFMWKYS